ncbi:hypothetical protein AAMO2058_000113300 [Amorphochlora amoebiformis]
MVLSLFLAISLASSQSLGGDIYSKTELNQISRFFFENVDVDGTGAVVASPSKSHPNYYYHWMRDGAISINIANVVLGNETCMPHYVSWVLKVQGTSDPNNIDVRGEPKFFMDGRVYNGPWGRPQNDGPALRAIALINYANQLIAKGRMQEVKDTLYSTDLNKPGIKFDLEYVAHQWQQTSFDLWEEVNGHHFFTKMVQRKALVIGAQLANRLGDTGAGTYYQAQAKSMEPSIQAFWDASSGVIKATMTPHGGPQKYLDLDSAVHLGVLYGYADDGFFSYTDSKVLSSVGKLKEVMYSDGMYPINAKDDQAKIPGYLIGRYPNDTYDGYESGSVGNPWILCTQSLAELHYRAAKGFYSMLNDTSKHLDEHSKLFLSPLLQSYGYAPRSDESIHLGIASMALVLEGDALLTRAKRHLNKLHMSEQINLDSGFEQGANDLTWSYGTLFGALDARKKAIEAMAGSV